jgi:DNA-directed RNA polymerase II subunit RPB7
MYFVVSDRKAITMRPCDLGPFFQQRVEAKLRLDLEGSLSKNHDGTIVYIFQITDRSKPRVQDSSGCVVVEVGFDAIVFRPFKNEVIDCVVSEVTRLGFFAYFGPMKVFVSKSCVPEDMDFEAETNSLSTGDGSQVIRVDSEVRVRILGVRRDGTQLFSIGTIDGDYLGPTAARGATEEQVGFAQLM